MSVFKKLFVLIVILLFGLTACLPLDSGVISLEFDVKKLEINLGQTPTLKPIITKGRFARDIKIVYISLDEDILIYEDGVLTPLKEGKVQVKAYLESDDSIYATCEVIVVNEAKYKISYALNDGVNDSRNPDYYTAEDLPISLYEPTKEGYTFKGWFLNRDFSGPEVTILQDISVNIILYANWEKRYNIGNSITYHLNGGTNHSLNIGSINESDLPFTLYEPTKVGYTFLGWYLNNSFTGEKVTTITELKDISLYAKWEEINYSIYYVLNGGTNHSNNPLSFGISDLPFSLLSPSRAGATFKGWYDNPGLSGEKITQITSLNNMVLYAGWESNNVTNYTITYNLNGGQNNPANPSQFNENDLPLNVYEPTRSGYIFKGWYNNSSFSGEKITRISSIGNVTLYANWEATSLPTYTITYYLNGGVNSPSNPVQFTESILPYTLHEPTRSGYIFRGWYSNPSFSGDKVLKLYFARDTTLYAKWEELVSYSITYILNGGTNHLNNVSSYTENNLPLALYWPSKEGYVFEGWYADVNFSGSRINSLTEAKNIVLYAKWGTITDDNALVALEIAEHSRLRSDFLFAKEIIEALEPTSSKQALLDRLNAIEILKEDVIIDDSTIIN